MRKRLLLVLLFLLLLVTPASAATTSRFWYWFDGDLYSRLIFPTTQTNIQTVLDQASPTRKLYVQQSPGNLDADSTIWIHGNTVWKGGGKGISTITRTRFNAGDAANTGHVLISAKYGQHTPNNTTIGGLPTDSLTNIHLEGFTIDGNYLAHGALTNPNTPGNFGIQLWFVDGATIRDVEVKNTFQTGVELDACKNSSISGLTTRDTGRQVMLGTRNGLNINNNSPNQNAYLAGWGRGFTLSDLQIINPRGAAIDFSSVSDITVNGVYMSMANDSISNQGPPSQDEPYGFEIEGNSAVVPSMENFTIANVIGRGFTSLFLTKGGTGVVPLRKLKISNVVWEAHPDSSYRGAMAFGSNQGGATDIDITNAHFSNLNSRNVLGDCSPFCTTAGLYIMADNSTDSLRNVNISNVTLEFKRGDTFRSGGHGIVLGSNTENVTLKNIKIIGAQDQGLRILAQNGDFGRDIVAEDVYVYGAQREGFSMQMSGTNGGLNGISWIRCKAKDTNLSGSGYAFQINNAVPGAVMRNLRVEGCAAIKTSGSNMLGLRLLQSSGTLDSIYVLNNDFNRTGTPYTETGTITNIFRSDIGAFGRESSTPFAMDNNEWIYFKDATGTYRPTVKVDSVTNALHIQPAGNIDIYGVDGVLRQRIFSGGGMSITGTNAQLQLGGFVYLIDNGNERRIVNKNAGERIYVRNAANTANLVAIDDDGDVWVGSSLTTVDSLVAGGPLRANSEADVTDSLTVGKTSRFMDDAFFWNKVYVDDSLRVEGRVYIGTGGIYLRTGAGDRQSIYNSSSTINRFVLPDNGPGSAASWEIRNHDNTLLLWDFHQDANDKGWLHFQGNYTQATLPTGGAAPTSGAVVFCTDCTEGSGSPCTSGGNGSLAIRQNSAWYCP